MLKSRASFLNHSKLAANYLNCQIKKEALKRLFHFALINTIENHPYTYPRLLNTQYCCNCYLISDRAFFCLLILFAIKYSFKNLLTRIALSYILGLLKARKQAKDYE